MAISNPPCSRDCLHCPYPDLPDWCLAEDMTAGERQELREIQVNILAPKTAQEKKRAAKQKAYREANREEIAAKQKAYREANREEIAAKQKAYREANREEIAAKRKAYREARRDATPHKAEKQRRMNNGQRPGNPRLSAQPRAGRAMEF